MKTQTQRRLYTETCGIGDCPYSIDHKNLGVAKRTIAVHRSKAHGIKGTSPSTVQWRKRQTNRMKDHMNGLEQTDKRLKTSPELIAAIRARMGEEGSKSQKVREAFSQVYGANEKTWPMKFTSSNVDRLWKKAEMADTPPAVREEPTTMNGPAIDLSSVKTPPSALHLLAAKGRMIPVSAIPKVCPWCEMRIRQMILAGIAENGLASSPTES